ncbi:tRNA (adenosine(37)-N6)-threonylcarbamoyltransferase complex ATPase subunit type 1 TsaE [Paenibacillus sp. NEAU-GSW1]|uniref:tRNA (adenosine(37)-N6)-threonylcarbamoyltransferase complex ATPase subunit type 1 TsaE n=1 Tax=Paenibacillus sp. NEAU-GSW1 TaxID=2682486 RepID=UPI0012E26B57|nr:tRNA (adenosine(37)-N6)-threonylcarbamoyltransferase complex ATPase subunit type 1 TsaE [Paenibacillus sp. NEAU-GSW1]MUT68464.1 tRNA (adenosine(37)-N6)-threonylcarbamoyltransferase complex ATPase subunit type 1 TsaE [Paenibacillus sp. NEAU-GSW1]
MSKSGEALFIVRDERETAALAQKIAAKAHAGALLALDGDLGAGKTTFSQYFAKAIGVKEIVNSPTFTIIKEYDGADMPFYHMDVYRLSMDEADELGLDEYFFGNGVTIVEWASLIEELLPENRLNIYIEHGGDGERRFRLTGIGEPYALWCAEWNGIGAGNDDSGKK